MHQCLTCKWNASKRVAVQHERGPRKVKPKIHSVSSMILPASSSGTSAPPVACSSSPIMASLSASSVSNQLTRKIKYPLQASQSQFSCLSTMENYNSFSTIINQVNSMLSWFDISLFDFSVLSDNTVRSGGPPSLYHDQLVANSTFI